MENNEEEFIKSEKVKIGRLKIIFITALFIFYSVLFFSSAIVAVSLFAIAFHVIFLIIAFFYIEENYLKNIFYFNYQKIVVADFKNKFIHEIALKYVHRWNNFEEIDKTEKTRYLYVETLSFNFIIDDKNYSNFDQILEFFQNSNTSKDNSLNDATKNFHKNVLNSKTQIKLSGIFLLISFISFYIFFFSFVFKNDSKEIKYFSGTISKITKSSSRGEKWINLNLKNIPEITFRIYGHTDFFLEAKNNVTNNELINLNRKIKIGVLQADFDWKIENKFIKMIDINSPNLDVKKYYLDKN